MTVVSTTEDADALTLTLVAEFDAGVDRIWGLWEDPRQLEQWWGAPAFPATFTRHDFVPGGESRFHMTGPNGETPRGWWRTDTVDKASRIQFANGLAADDGEPVPDMPPMPTVMTMTSYGDRSRMTVTTHFVDAAQMARIRDMGIAGGMTLAMGQIDAILAQMPA